MHGSHSSSIRFGRFTADLTARELRDGEARVDLRPKSFDVLSRLLATPGTLVTKDELFAAAWPDVTVSDESLARCISDIRIALGGSAHRIIKTVPRRGYVLVLSATEIASPAISPAVSVPPLPRPLPISSAPQPAHETRRRAALASGALIACAALSALAMRRHRTPDPTGGDRPSVVVLPFATGGPDAVPDYLADGVTEDISLRLARFGDLVVIARDSAFAYRDSRAPPGVIARALNVRYLVQGSIRRTGDLVRITAQLVDGESGVQRWGEVYNRSMRELSALQDEVAQHIASALIGRIEQRELERARQKPPETLAAYDLYLHGKHLLAGVDSAGRGEYGARVLAARGPLQAAVDIDPRYAPALTALADAHHRAWIVPTTHPVTRGEYQSSATSDVALRLAEAAVASDPWYPDARAQLAWSLHWQYRREAAMAEFRRAVDLNPNLADGRFPLLLTHAGRPAEAIAFMQRVMRLDPFHRPIYLSYLANAYFLDGQYEQSVITGRIAAARMPAVVQPQIWLAAACVLTGRLEEAVGAAAEVSRLMPDFSITRFLAVIRLARDGDAARLGSALRAAGLPD